MNHASNRPRSALAEAADRMGQLSRTLHEQELISRGAIRFPVTDVYSMSPDEAWSKKFMSQGIGPVPDCTAPGKVCPIPFAAASGASVAEAPAMERALSPGTQGPIGQAIGKPAKRSWFRRRSP